MTASVARDPIRTTPYTTVILAMSADGKIAAADRGAARFPSRFDQQHLQTRIAEADATLFGAGTLRAYGTTRSITHADLLQRRRDQGKTAQPIHIVCSASASLDPDWRFFAQPVPRWLLTTPAAAAQWYEHPGFDRILPLLSPSSDWPNIFAHLQTQGIHRLLVMGGGQLVAALAAADLLDELWLTVCPLLVGGQTAPTPMDGPGFSVSAAPQLQLLSAEPVGNEVFLHYRRVRSSPLTTQPSQ
ncbi:MAG: RibD family protein [Cyanobacteria bacterium J06648_16]